MAPEKPAKEGMIGGLTTKQKMIAVALVIILLIVIWQLRGIFSSGEIATITPAAGGITAQAPGTAPGAPAVPGAAPTPGAAPGPTQAPVQTIKEVAVPVNPEILEVQKQTAQKYLDELNQLQILKIQREIAETNQAIASARLATVTAEKSVSDLLTKPTTPPPAVPTAIPTGTFATPMISPGAGFPEITPPPPAATTTAPAPVPETPYLVISVAMQNGRWSAVISLQGKLFHVVQGDILPPDNSQVIAINRSGVILQKGRKRRKVSIISSI